MCAQVTNYSYCLLVPEHGKGHTEPRGHTQVNHILASVTEAHGCDFDCLRACRKGAYITLHWEANSGRQVPVRMIERLPAVQFDDRLWN